MASGGRGNRRGGGFGEFPDPFANFGMGGARGGSIFDVFDNDPFFNDLFFTRPFGSFFSQPGGLLGAHGFLGPNSFFPSQTAPPQAPSRAGYLDNRPHNPPGRLKRARPPQATDHRLVRPKSCPVRARTLTNREPYRARPREARVKPRMTPSHRSPRRQVHQRDPVVVEVADEDDSDEPRPPSLSGQEPIIEHPDDDVRPATAAPEERPRQPRNVVRQGGPLSMTYNNSGRAYSFQSSSVSYGGPNGTYYSSSASRRLGPDGVIEEEFQEKDSTSGHEVQRISRGLGEKGRSITRKRTSEGREATMDTLHNIQEEEVPDFERTWEERVKNLPRWNKNGSNTIGSGSRSRAALPASGKYHGSWPSNQN